MHVHTLLRAALADAHVVAGERLDLLRRAHKAFADTLTKTREPKLRAFAFGSSPPRGSEIVYEYTG